MLWRGRGLVWWSGVVLVNCWVDGTTPHPQDSETAGRSAREEVLNWVSQVSTGNLGITCTTETLYRFAPAQVEVGRFRAVQQKADLMVKVLRRLSDAEKVVVEGLLEAQEVEEEEGGARVTGARVLRHQMGRGMSLTSARLPSLPFTRLTPGPVTNISTATSEWVEKQPWALGRRKWPRPAPNATERYQAPEEEGALGRWTFPYFLCEGKRWMLTYTAPLHGSWRQESSAMELLSVDVDVTSLDINQCDIDEDSEEDTSTQLSFFRGSHKCHRETSQCVFRAGSGWVRGGYVCQCQSGYFPKNKTFNGTLVEVAWEGLQLQDNPTYRILYHCHPCPPLCPECEDDSPCNAFYNWPFRIALLTISSLCIMFTFVLMGLVYHYRSVKVFRLASPTFLCICLIGCTIMYLEMAAIFPVLETYSCVATKWTRHLGFCITFSSLLMKTWRVSLTYRVTSAHKIKLTDKQLLQWLTPILLIVLVYLAAWTLSATPQAVVIKDYNDLQFMQCAYNWWDHSLAMGEVLFLMWGVKVCFSVRKAESFFDEAKYISWAVYNIAVVNIVMVAFHLLIFDRAGPDIKYLFGFLRTQLSTSTTVLLIFGPKFYRIVQGTGDQYDNRARAKGVTASFSLNGLGVMNDEPADLSQENEELKEEIQKLAAQMEFMKIVHMEMNNRHLKPKPSGYFSEKNPVMAGPTTPSGPPRGEAGAENAAPPKLSSPAAELAADKV